MERHFEVGMVTWEVGCYFWYTANESIKEKLYFSGLKKELFYGEKCLLLWKFT